MKGQRAGHITALTVRQRRFDWIPSCFFCCFFFMSSPAKGLPFSTLVQLWGVGAMQSLSQSWRYLQVGETSKQTLPCLTPRELSASSAAAPEIDAGQMLLRKIR